MSDPDDFEPVPPYPDRVPGGIVERALMTRDPNREAVWKRWAAEDAALGLKQPHYGTSEDGTVVVEGRAGRHQGYTARRRVPR